MIDNIPPPERVTSYKIPMLVRFRPESTASKSLFEVVEPVGTHNKIFWRLVGQERDITKDHLDVSTSSKGQLMGKLVELAGQVKEPEPVYFAKPTIGECFAAAYNKSWPPSLNGVLNYFTNSAPLTVEKYDQFVDSFHRIVTEEYGQLDVDRKSFLAALAKKSRAQEIFADLKTGKMDPRLLIVINAAVMAYGSMVNALPIGFFLK